MSKAEFVGALVVVAVLAYVIGVLMALALVKGGRG